MAIYVTTSRKPSLLTRRLAKWLGRLLGGESENRGKRSVAEILERAEAAGLDRVLIIGEDHGNPTKLSFLQGGEWRESILLQGVVFSSGEVKSARIPKSVCGKADDATGKKILELLGVQEGREGRLVVAADAKQIVFELAGGQVGPVVKILRISNE